MNCIFCREDASSSQSVEHIIPESLGNEEHILPKGVICDACNNYFSRKIEGPLLAIPYMRHARSRMGVSNKRGRVPSMTGVLPSLQMPVEVWLNGPQIHLGGSENGDSLQRIERSILSGQTDTVILPIPREVNRRLMSRFLGKVAIEALTLRLMKVDGWQEEMLRVEALELLRRYVRRGDGPAEWEFSQRRLYAENAVFNDGREAFELLHEFDFIYAADRTLFFVLALFGEEFAIDMGDPSITNYRRWMADNNDRSPLAPW